MTTSAVPSIISVSSQKTPTMTSPSSPVQQSPSLPKHPLFGLWNPIYQGYLSNGVKEIDACDSSLWTQDYDDAHLFRTESAANYARQQFRDNYNITTVVSVMRYG